MYLDHALHQQAWMKLNSAQGAGKNVDIDSWHK